MTGEEILREINGEIPGESPTSTPGVIAGESLENIAKETMGGAHAGHEGAPGGFLEEVKGAITEEALEGILERFFDDIPKVPMGLFP